MPQPNPTGEPADTHNVAEPPLPVVVREVTLDVGLDEAWALVSDAQGLATWLGADVAFEPREGASGALVEADGTRRALRVDGIEPGRSVAFRWWPDDEPAAATGVTFELTPTPVGTRLRVTERPLAGARACAWRDAADGAAWDARLVLLEVGAHLRSRARCGLLPV